MSRVQQHDREQLMFQLGNELRKVSAYSVLLSQVAASRVGLHPTDLESLDILSWEGPVTAGRLAELTGLTTGAVTGLIDRLERAGYARRERDPHDRRRVIIHPQLEELEALVGPVFEPMARKVEDLLAEYNDDQLATLLGFVRRATQITLDHITELQRG